jgi:hypothetical protein
MFIKLGWMNYARHLAGFFQKSITFCLLIFALIMGMFAFSKGG